MPELAAGAADELDGLRSACDAAVAALLTARPELIVVVGTGPATGALPPPYRGSFTPWGVPVTVGDTEGAVPPLGPLLGLWLLERGGRHRGGPAAPVRVWTVAADAAPDVCAATGRTIAGLGAVSLLVMGDGSACHGPKAPGYDDPRAAAFDETVGAALTDADPGPLLAVDPGVAAELRATGRAPWQVLAGAAEGREWQGRAHYVRPYGVGYHVASWT